MCLNACTLETHVSLFDVDSNIADDGSLIVLMVFHTFLPVYT